MGQDSESHHAPDQGTISRLVSFGPPASYAEVSEAQGRLEASDSCHVQRPACEVDFRVLIEIDWWPQRNGQAESPFCLSDT